MYRRTALGALALAAVVLLVAGLATNWFGLASPRFQEGVQYEFQYTMKSAVPGTDANGNEISIATRQFVVDQTTMFPAAELGLVEDMSLPPNTFVWQKKTQPQVVVGGRVARQDYNFIEVRYNQAARERQTVVPHLGPPSQ